jgi:outer membrane receptor protein involved in Fe transport
MPALLAIFLLLSNPLGVAANYNGGVVFAAECCGTFYGSSDHLPGAVALAAATSAALRSEPAAATSAALRSDEPRATPATTGMPVSGTVVDVSDAPIPAASVRLETEAGWTADVLSGSDGRFVFTDVPAGRARLTASAPHFSSAVRTLVVPADGRPVELKLALAPAPFTEALTVTARRLETRGLDTPASTSVLTGADLLTGAAPLVDDALKVVPGFSLFRRSSSRQANPSAQGVTLRGIGASGASRTLVLSDGLPLNDPFGGWVYWNRVPQTAIDRIEVLRGGGSDLYGADALGGVVQILTFDPHRSRLRASVEGGSLGTGRVSFFGGGHRGAFGALASGEVSQTRGAVRVAADERGPVDTPAGSNYRTAIVAAGYRGPGAFRMDGRLNVFSEDRDNGTPLQVNDTNLRQLTIETGGMAGGGVWQARLSGASQGFDQAYSAVDGARASEQLTRLQRVPSRTASAAGQWTRPWGRHYLMTGLEGKWVEGRTEETGFFRGNPTSRTVVGGTQRTGSAFAQFNVVPSERVTLLTGVRGDAWVSDPTGGRYERQSASAVSPRASLSYRAGRNVVFQTSAYGAFRTPTLNELYRSFRVGDIVTDPAFRIEPERLTGLEGGVLFTGGDRSLRLVAFRQRLSDSIANVTVSVTPGLITRERRNVGEIGAAGFEVEGLVRPLAGLEIIGTAAVIDSRFDGGSPEAALAGNRVPHVARYHLTGSVRYSEPRLATFSIQARLTGPQFEDDRNELVLRRALVFDAYLGRSISRGIHAFAAVENLFDAEYDVGRIPVRTVGLPRAFRTGVRLFLP